MLSIIVIMYTGYLQYKVDSHVWHYYICTCTSKVYFVCEKALITEHV